MLSVLSFNSPGIKLFSKKAYVGTFKEGTAFLGLRVLEMNLGPFKTMLTTSLGRTPLPESSFFTQGDFFFHVKIKHCSAGAMLIFFLRFR